MSILILPIVGQLIPIFPVIKSSENRAMKAFPNISVSKLDGLPAEFDEYYADNLVLRNQLLKWNSYIKFHLFSIPPLTDKAFIGKEGWMYAIKDEMDHYVGNTILSQDTLNMFVETIKYRRHFLDSLNCMYYLVIVPIKTTIYPEYIPLSKRKDGQKTLTDQIVDELKYYTEINLIDLRGELIDHKGDYRLFHKTDNHWNEYGGYIASNYILDRISHDFPNIQPIDKLEYKIETVEAEGRLLTNLMGIFEGVKEQEFICTPMFDRLAFKGEKNNYPVPNYFPYKNSYERVYETNNPNLPKLLVIQDSFGTTLMPFLSEHFSKSVFIFDAWQHELQKEIVLKEEPDIYIQLVLESLLPNIYEN